MTLPDRRPADPPGPTGVPLSQTPTEALCFALGYVAARPVNADQWGGFCALVEELTRRTLPLPGSAVPTAQASVFQVLTHHMPPALARSIAMLYQSHRGQRWAKTGRRS